MLEIFNVVLIVIFALLIAFFVIEILLGIKKGVFYSTFRLLFMALLIILAMCTLDITIDAVGAFPIGSFFKYVVISGNGSSIAVPTSTIYGTLKDSLAAALQLFGFSGSSAELYNLSIGLAKMILKYALFIVDMILIVTLGNLLSILLWHIGFKHLVPKAIRKIAKVRWLAMIEEGVRYVLVAGMLIVPFSALANSVNQVWQKHKPNSSNETLVTIGGFIDTYNNSILAQTIFNWTTNGSGVTFDTNIMDSFTTVTINGVTTSLLEQISNISEIGTIFSGAIGEGSDLVIDINYLLSGELINALFSAINSSGLITLILPIAATLALNYDELANYVDTSLIDLSNVDWSKELENIEVLALDVLNSGLLSSFLDEDGAIDVSKMDMNKLITSFLSDESYGYLKRSLESIDNSELLSVIVPAVAMYAMESNPGISGLLNSISLSDMSMIKWGKELGIVYDAIFRLNKIDPRFIESLTSLLPNSGETSTLIETDTQDPIAKRSSPLRDDTEPEEGTEDELEDSNPMGKIFELLIENASALKSVLLGDFDSDGNIINCNDDGLTIINDANGKPINGRYYRLFDTSLMKYIFPMISTTLIDIMKQSTKEGPELDYDGLNKVLKDLITNGSQIKNFKNEFSNVINTLTIMGGSTDILGLLDNSTEMDGLNEQEIKIMQKALISMDKSKILSTVLKPSLVNVITQDTMKEELGTIGINTDDLNFDIPNLGQEMADLLGIFIPVQNLIGVLGGGLSASEIITKFSEESENLALLLDTLFESEIINPKDKFYDNDLDNNYFGILNFIFGEGDGSSMPSGISFKESIVTLRPSRHGVEHNWTNSKTINGDYYRDMYGRPIYDGENGYLVQVLSTLGMKNSEGKTILDAFNDPSYNIYEHIGDLDKDFGISNIMKAVDKSSIFSATFGEFLDHNLEATGLINIDQGMTFDNVENWQIEGENFASLCKAVSNLGELDFSNLDLMNITDIPSLNQTLHALANSGVFTDKTTGDYLFNVFLYEKLESTLSNMSGNNFLNDPNTDSDPTYFKVMSDFTLTKEGNIYKSTAEMETWNSTGWMESYINMSKDEISSVENNQDFIDGFYHSDEIGKISYFLKTIQDAKTDINNSLEAGDTPFDNPIDALTSGKISSADLGKVMLAMNDVKELRMLVYHSFDHILKTIDIGIDSTNMNYSLESANIDYLVESTTTKEMRDAEINYTVGVVSDFENSGIMDSTDASEIKNLIGKPENIYYLRDALVKLDSSYIFHRAGPRVIGEKTTLQETLYFYLESDAVQEIYYHVDSPKDQANSSLYTDGKTKAAHNIDEYFVYTNADYEKQIAEINRIVEIISSLTGGYRHYEAISLDENNVPSYIAGSAYEGQSVTSYGGLKDANNDVTIDLTNVDITGVTSEAVEEVLNNLNISDLLYDCVPNAIGIMVSHIDSNYDFFNGNHAVSFSDANPYYLYTEFTGESNPDYEKRFYREGVAADAGREDADELSILANLVDEINEITKPENLGTSGIDNFATFDEEKENRVCGLIESISDDLYMSFTLHKADDDKFLSAYQNDPSTPKLTVFEQVMNKIYFDTGLAGYAYDSSRDISFSDAETKLIHNIKAMTKQDLSSLTNSVGFSNHWNDEVRSLTDLMKAIAPLLDSSNISENSASLSLSNPALSPSEITTIMNKMNQVDVTSDALGHFLKSSFNEVSLNVYSTYNNIDRANYYLSQRDFASDTGIKSVSDVLSVFSIKDTNGDHTGYYKLDEESFTKFIESGGSSSPILKFINETKIYEDKFELSIGNDVNVDANFIYQLFKEATLSDYIFGSTTDEKISVIEKLMHDNVSFGTFDSDVEGAAIDNLLVHGQNFSTANVNYDSSDINTIIAVKQMLYNAMIGTVGTETNGVFKPYSTHRAYLASEIMAGVLDDIIVVEETNMPEAITDAQKLVFRIKGEPANNIKVSSYLDYGPNTYHYLNQNEARGMYGVLSLLKGDDVSAYLTFERENDDFNNLGFINCFEYMEYIDENNQKSNSRFAAITYVRYMRSTFDTLWHSAPIITAPSVSNPTLEELENYTIGFASLGTAIADSINLS
jgi:hypothetical protein